MPFGFPLMLEVAGRRVVVIGDDAVRAGKVETLVAAGADDVLVVAQGPASRLVALEAIEGVTVDRRAFSPADLDGALLCVASDRSVAGRRAIAAAARTRGVLVNVMDDIANCDWSAPAVTRRGELVVSVATGGASPALAKHLRRRFEAEFGAEWAEILRVLRAVRAETMPSLPDLAERARRWGAAIDTAEAVELVREGRSEDLAARLRARLLDAAEQVPP